MPRLPLQKEKELDEAAVAGQFLKMAQKSEVIKRLLASEGVGECSARGRSLLKLITFSFHFELRLLTFYITYVFNTYNI